MVQVKNKVCLIVHDGWGIAATPGLEGNAIEAAPTPNMDTLTRNHSSRELSAHGTAVGLSEGLMGNSEVGHLNIGAGRIVWQDIVRIDVSIKKKEFHTNPTILRSFKRAKDGNGRLHFLGLISDGGVHSHINHLYALLETAKAGGVPETYVHFFGDGRDTAPRSAAGYCQDVVGFMEKEGYGELATVVGRYYAMDRDKRWERVGVAVDGLVRGVGEELLKGKGVGEVIKENYEKDVTDEFLKPIIVNGDKGRIKDGDTLFLFNYRSDRMREISTILGSLDPSLSIPVPKDLHITTMSQYNPTFPFPTAFPPQSMSNVLAETLSSQSIHQSHIAETEKYAHVTFFFNGGIERAFPNEHRYLIPSPKTPTYDHEPRMSVGLVADKVAQLIHEGESEFIMCNFAPPDMVGHTGVFDAAVEAVRGTDEAVGVVWEACREKGYVLVVTADHGNVEQMRDLETGEAYTAHTTNRVPFIVAGGGEGQGQGVRLRLRGDGEGEEGALCDVAPTVLDLLGLVQPEEMTGRSLLVHE
ncbi:BPG-independent [Lentinula detonsa]|uniref:2,3-bisphosphoglycerate-independent phosphoglycerate mutase n=1 Tax=Lentinula detonsa TaxID=2804962 RepID=A0A9W8NRY4_9AGAR|nr:BPG-independent [Lentinula detonsa]